MELRFAILGAGNGGLAVAGDLMDRGFTVTGIYDRYPAMIDPIRAARGITYLAKDTPQFFPVANATTEMADAVAGANVLMVVVPAFAHEFIARELARCVRPGQLVVLSPGYFGGCLAFDQIFREAGAEGYRLAEAMILLHAARLYAPASVSILRTKRVLHMASLPGHEIGRIIDLLKPAMPQLVPVANVLETSLNNPNPVSHVPTTLLNMGLVERKEERDHFDFNDLVTPAAARIIEGVDQERLALVRAMGLWGLSHDEWVAVSYGQEQRVIRPVTGAIPESSRTLPPRYIDEDVPFGLVPMLSLADLLGLDLPHMRALVTLACTARGVDFRASGRRLDNLGLGGLSPEQIKARIA